MTTKEPWDRGDQCVKSKDILLFKSNIEKKIMM